jgi:hypothetical protein
MTALWFTARLWLVNRLLALAVQNVAIAPAEVRAERDRLR